MDPLDPTVRGILFLVAVVAFVVASFLDDSGAPWRMRLVAAGLAFFAFVPMWDSFAAS